MKQLIRQNTFETNSSSIHCLVIEKDSKINENIDIEGVILPFYHKDAVNKYVENIYVKPIDKARYLWTICCLLENYGEAEEFVEEFKSILRSIFPKCTFEYVEEPEYLEDFEGLMDNPKLLDYDFILNLVKKGKIIFTSRDGCYDDPKYDLLMSDLRHMEHTEKDIIWSEG